VRLTPRLPQASIAFYASNASTKTLYRMSQFSGGKIWHDSGENS
jgi:hypothetical protein